MCRCSISMAETNTEWNGVRKLIIPMHIIVDVLFYNWNPVFHLEKDKLGKQRITSL